MAEDKKHEVLNILQNLDRRLTRSQEDQQLTRLQEILKSDVDVNGMVPNQRDFNFLRWAIYNTTNEKIIEHLITNGADVNKCVGHGKTPLMDAIRVKSLNKVKVLVSHGANVNQVVSTWFTNTPLTYAISSIMFNPSYQISIVEYLLQHGADPNLIGDSGRTPLSWAVCKRNVQIVQLLIANGAIINKADEDGETPIMLARLQENQEILQMLNVPDNTEVNPLDLQNTAIQKNSLDDVKLLSIDRININTSDDKGNTPLQNAIMSGIDRININTSDDKGNTSLQNAIMSGNIEKVEHLIESKANVCKLGKNGKTPLLIAVETGNLDIIKLLLRHGAVDTIQSAFFQAVTLQNLEIINLLIEHGALLNVNYKDGHTALTKSVEVENLDVVKVLLEHGADVNMPKSDGTSPLSLALKTGNLEICKYLINNDGKLTSNSDQAFEYLPKYIDEDNFEMVQIMLELGAKLDTIYECGETPLTKAANLENFEMVKYLIEKGANVNQSNGNGKVPLAVAASNKDIRIAKFLIQSQACRDLAKEEIEEFANFSEDFDIYLKMLKKNSDSCGNDTKMNSLGGFDQEAAP